MATIPSRAATFFCLFHDSVTSSSSTRLGFYCAHSKAVSCSLLFRLKRRLLQESDIEESEKWVYHTCTRSRTGEVWAGPPPYDPVTQHPLDSASSARVQQKKSSRQASGIGCMYAPFRCLDVSHAKKKTKKWSEKIKHERGESSELWRGREKGDGWLVCRYLPVMDHSLICTRSLFKQVIAQWRKKGPCISTSYWIDFFHGRK